MSEDRTKDLHNAKSLEDRVFARFEGMEIRITNLESRQYDTKPIWERALAEIAETNRRVGELTAEIAETNRRVGELTAEMRAGHEALRNDLRFEFLTVNEALRNDLRSEFQTGLESLRTDLRFEFQTGFEGLRKEMKEEFASVRHTMEQDFRGVNRRIDSLNKSFMQMQTYQRFFDRRLTNLEKQMEQR